MPIYEFRCSKCKKKFSLNMSLADLEGKRYKCPKCGGRKLAQLITGFLTVTSRKS